MENPAETLNIAINEWLKESWRGEVFYVPNEQSEQLDTHMEGL